MYTKQQLEAIYNLILYASETLTKYDEPLLDEVIEKTKKLLDN